jgi:hypothetical protein
MSIEACARHRPYSLSRPRAGPSSCPSWMRGVPLRIRGDGAPGGTAVVVEVAASPLEDAEAPPGAPPGQVLSARAHLRSSCSASPNVGGGICCAGPRFPFSRPRLPGPACRPPAPCGWPLSVRRLRSAAGGTLRQPAPGGRLVLAARRSPGAARVLGRSVHLPPAGAASCSITRRL